MFKSKKAQGIPMETVVIAIIVLVVLVVIISFFVFGTGTVLDKFRTIFAGKADDTALVRTTCTQLCDTATTLEPGQQQANSGFCVKKFKLDTKNTGKPDPYEKGSSKFKAYYCFDPEIAVSCSVSCPAKDTIEDRTY